MERNHSIPVQQPRLTTCKHFLCGKLETSFSLDPECLEEHTQCNEFIPGGLWWPSMYIFEIYVSHCVKFLSFWM
jgi:hypothetical protein